MFEKEAEEIAKDIYIHHFDDDVNYTCVLQAITVGAQKGAEFGYNKANEWHYMKEGDLPINKNDGTTYLLYTIYGEGSSPVVAHFMGRDKQELMNVWTGAILTEDKIVAWRELVLPKE